MVMQGDEATLAYGMEGKDGNQSLGCPLLTSSYSSSIT